MTRERSVSGPTPLWSPQPEEIESSQLTAYVELAAKRPRASISSDYDALWSGRLIDPDAFWQSIWDYFEVISSGEAASVLDGMEMPGARWFEGTEVNYAEHIFRDREEGDVAILAASERPLRSVTSGRPAPDVASAAAGMRRWGSVPETASLPTCRIRPRRWSLSLLRRASVRSGRAARRTSGRAQCPIASPRSSRRSLLAVDGYDYGGKGLRSSGYRQRAGRVDAIARKGRDPAVTLAEAAKRRVPALTVGALQMARHEIRSTAHPKGRSRGMPCWRSIRPPALEFTRVPFSHPLWILYSSGTTRSSEGDSPGPGRNPARTPQEDEPPPRRACR